MVESTIQDLRHSVRALRRAPGFTAVVLLTLALGIGANTAVFSVIDAVLLHPVPFPEPGRLVAVYAASQTEPKGSVSYLNFIDWQQRARSFDSLSVWRQDSFVLTERGPAEQLLGLMISADFLRTLQVQPVLGRGFRVDEDRVGGAAVVLLGESFWRRRFDGDPGIVGRRITLNALPYTVVGIVPRSVQLIEADASRPNDVFVPIGQYADPLFRQRGANLGSHSMARLAAGATVAGARAEMTTIARVLERQYPEANTGKGVVVLPLEQDIAGDLRPILLALTAAVAFVLLIAVANVANLLLVRTTARAQEMAVRLAIGGSRARLMRQLATEGLLLALAGGAAGVGLAAVGTRAALALLPDALPAIVNVGVNLRVLAFAVAASIVTGTLVAIVPASRSTGGRLADNLRHSRGVRVTHHRTQRAIVMVQVAVTLVLLLAAGLMIRSLSRVWNVNPGFDPERVLTFFTGFTGERAASATRMRAELDQLSERLTRIPGVAHASVIVGAPVLRGTTTMSYWRTDRPQPPVRSETHFVGVGADYFATMRIPLRRGRLLEPQDTHERRRVVVIDEVLARQTFPNEDPIGKHLRFEEFDVDAEVVGVVGHVAQTGLDGDAMAPVRAQMYITYSQLPDYIATIFAGTIGVAVRANSESSMLIGAIRSDLAAFNPDQAIHTEQWMNEVVAESLASRRFSMTVLAAFALVALVLAVVGIYGTVSYIVRQRSHEIGLRAALGGRPRDLLLMVLGEGGRLAVAGIVAGVAGGLATTRLLTTLLFEVSPTDATTFVAASAALLAVVLAACYLPARRASRIDPMLALRQD